MIIGLILVKSMPSVIAQGMLFFGFIYVFAKILDICSDIRKDRNKRKSQRMNELSKPKSTIIPRQNQVRIAPPPSKDTKKRYLLEFDCIKYLIRCLNSQKEDIGQIEIYTAIEPIDIEDEIVFYGISDKRASLKLLYPNLAQCEIIERKENYHARFELQIDDITIDENGIDLIPLEEKDTMFTMNDIMYKGKIVSLKKIPEKYDTAAVKSSMAFDNWVNNK